MNAREKKLLVATFFVLGIGLTVWLGDSTAPAEAEPASPAAAAPPPPGQSEESAGAVAATFSVSQLSSFLERFPRSTVIRASGDPFQTLTSGQGQQRMATPQPAPSVRDLPHLGGVFSSGSIRGALLDGEVVFAGESVDGHYRLLNVADDRVRILFQEQEVDLVYDPVNSSGVEGKGSDDENNE